MKAIIGGSMLPQTSMALAADIARAQEHLRKCEIVVLEQACREHPNSPEIVRLQQARLALHDLKVCDAGNPAGD